MVFLFYLNFKLHSAVRVPSCVLRVFFCFHFILTVGPTAGYCFFRRAAADLDTNTMQTNKKRKYIRNGTYIWTQRQRRLLHQRLVADSITWNKWKSMLSALRYDKNRFQTIRKFRIWIISQWNAVCLSYPSVDSLMSRPFFALIEPKIGKNIKKVNKLSFINCYIGATVWCTSLFKIYFICANIVWSTTLAHYVNVRRAQRHKIIATFASHK